MKYPFSKRTAHAATGLLLSCLLFSSCALPGSPDSKKPERKKMPGWSQQGAEDGYPAFEPTYFGAAISDGWSGSTSDQSIVVSDTTLTLAGKTFRLRAVAIPSPANDHLLENVRLYESLVSPYLRPWLAQGSADGVLIDLRIHRDGSLPAHRADLAVEVGSAGITLPLVYIWDDATTGRANQYMHALNDLSSVSCKVLGKQ